MIAIARENLTLEAALGAPLAPDLWTLVGMGPLLWVVRAGGQAVGYCAHLIQPHPLFGERQALCVAIYLQPAHRGVARRLVAEIETALRAEGVAVIAYSVPHQGRAGAFFEAIGYPCEEMVMARRIHALPA